jgi:hypothetical protein
LSDDDEDILLLLLLIRRRRKRLRAANRQLWRNDGFWEDKESMIILWTNSGQIFTNLSSKFASLTSSLVGLSSIVCSLSAMFSLGEYNACALLCCEKLRWAVCRTLGIFVTNDRKNQCLIFVEGGKGGGVWITFHNEKKAVSRFTCLKKAISRKTRF